MVERNKDGPFPLLSRESSVLVNEDPDRKRKTFGGVYIFFKKKQIKLLF